jgi:hypothetical protein
MSKNENVSPLELLKEDLADSVFDKTQWQGRSTDWLLQWVVDFVSRTDLEIGITLTIGGNLVSGRLISHKKYFEVLSEDLSKAFEAVGSDSAKAIKDLFTSFVPTEHAGEEEPSPQYLHLRESRVFTSSGGPISSVGALWRGKISSVDGIIFGQATNT